MNGKMITLSLCCACMLNAGWYDDIKEAANSTATFASDTYDQNKKIYDDYSQEKEEKEKKEKEDNARQELNNNIKIFNVKNVDGIKLFYKKLNNRDITKETIDLFVDVEIRAKLEDSTGEIEYLYSLLSGLKKAHNNIKKLTTNADMLSGEIEENEDIDDLIKEVKYLMYAWVLPFEILSTADILNNSLFENSKTFYENERKTIYSGYANFIYSLMKKRDFLYLNTLSINEKSYLDMITDENNANKSIIFMHKPKKNSDDISLSSPMNDNWYDMIKVYIQLQDAFYKIRKEVNGIISTLESTPNQEKIMTDLVLESDKRDKLYRKLDEAVRYNIFDIPTILYSNLYKAEFSKHTGTLIKAQLDKDKDKMADTVVHFSFATGAMQQYVTNNTKHLIIKTQHDFKKEFEDEEWKEIVTRAKLNNDWLKMLRKIKVEDR